MRLKTFYPDGLCGAKTRAGHPCRCLKVYKSGRCSFHGGLSTGPKTPEGKAKAALNLLKVKHHIGTGPTSARGKAKVAMNLRNSPSWIKHRQRLSSIPEPEPIQGKKMRRMIREAMLMDAREDAREALLLAPDAVSIMAAAREAQRLEHQLDQIDRASLAARKGHRTKKAKRSDLSARLERARQRTEK